MSEEGNAKIAPGFDISDYDSEWFSKDQDRM